MRGLRNGHKIILVDSPTGKTKEELVKEVKDTAQFAVTVAIFFGAFLYDMMKAGGANENQSWRTLIWAVGVAFYIVNYLLVEFGRADLTKKWFHRVRASLVIGILTFVPVILIGAVYYNTMPPFVLTWIFYICLLASLLMPIVTFNLIIWRLDWVAVRSMFKRWRTGHW